MQQGGGKIFSFGKSRAKEGEGDKKFTFKDVAGVDDKDYQLTKATQNQGDYLHIVGDGASGWFVKSSRGTWTQE